MMGLTLTTAPTEKPVCLEDAKLHLRVTGDKEDGRIEGLIEAATARVEQDLGEKQLVTATYTYTADEFPIRIELPRPPLQSVASIQYVDANGSTQTLSSSLYEVVTNTPIGYVKPAYNQTWPTTRCDPGSTILTVVYTAGYGAASAVPAALVEAVKMALTDLYDQNSALTPFSLMDNPAYRALLSPYALVNYA